MQHIQRFLVRAFILAAVFNITPAQAQTGGYAITGRGPDYRVWQKTTIENGTNRVHQYIELATGMYYTNASGQLAESREQITLLPAGGAAALQGRHKVYFPADIYNGALEVVTPDGRQLYSRPLGVSYDDGSNTVFIGTLQHAQGWLTSSNQVTYRNAFTNLAADLVCTYRRSGFECDLVFRRQPPAPDQFGLNNGSSRLQLVTEFFNTQDPQEIPGQTNRMFGLQDSTLRFGQLTMTHGRAFAINSTNSASQRVRTTRPVYKRWLHIQGRTFLIEELPLKYLADDLATLPLSASAAPNNQEPKSKTLLASRHLEFPPVHELVSDTNRILIASARMNKQPGVVLDYDEIDWSGENNFTFQGGTTYYINGSGEFRGTTTFEGGAVIKGGELDFDYGTNIICSPDLNNPTVFTSPNDDNYGETIDGSSGVPSLDEGAFLSGVPDHCILRNMIFLYGPIGVESWLSQCDIWNCQFINFDGCAIMMDGDGNAFLGLHNVLFAQGMNGDGAVDAVDNDIIVGEQVTADHMPCLVNWEGSNIQLFLTNSLLTSCALAYRVTCVTDDVVCFSTTPHDTYQPDSLNCNYYLWSTSPYRNIGTTGINPILFAELQIMTTYAPWYGYYPDNDGAPDLGYHYPLSGDSTNVDTDFDGLPDWWEIYYYGTNYGTLNLSLTNLDLNGNTLLSDYLSSPLKKSFS